MKFYRSRFVGFEIPPGVFEVIDINITLNSLLKVNVVIRDITMKARSKTSNILRFDRKSLINILLVSAPDWD